MKHLLTLLLLLSLSTCIWGQKALRQFEVTPFLRYDQYPEFTYSYNSVTSNLVIIDGLSWGINLAYKYPLSKTLHIKAGLGYYRYSFNEIDGYNSMWGKSDTRNINYLSDVYVMFYTKKYWYHCLSAQAGIDKTFALNKNTTIVSGVTLTDYYTFSQYYHINYDSPAGPPRHRYILNKRRNFAYGADLHAGLLKKVSKVTIGPLIILPVYDSWKQDDTFPRADGMTESNSDSRSKWFRGIGVGISCNYTLTRK